METSKDTVRLRIFGLIKSRKVTALQLSKATGISGGNISDWKAGKVNPSAAAVQKVAKFFNVSSDYIYGATDNPNPPTADNSLKGAIDEDVLWVPILGKVRAGRGGVAQDEVCGYEAVPAGAIKGESAMYFFLRVEGDSMFPKILDGDLVLVRRQTSVDSGELGVVIVNGEEGVVKRIKYTDDMIELVSENESYKKRVFEGSEVQLVQVVGKVMRIVRDV